MRKSIKFIFTILFISVASNASVVEVSGQLESKDNRVSDYSDFIIYLVKPVQKVQNPKASKVHNIIQVNKQFSPRVLGVRSGDRVSFENRDNLFHNVFSLDPVNKFDLGLYKGKIKYKEDRSTPLNKKFSTEVKMKGNRRVNVFCNIHQAMQTSIYSFEHPFFTQPDRTGAFSLPIPKNLKEFTIRIEGAFLDKPIERRITSQKQISILFEALATSPAQRQLNHRDKDGKAYKDISENEDEYY